MTGKIVKETLIFPIYLLYSPRQTQPVRNLAIVGLKLLGVLGIYWSINGIAQLIVFFGRPLATGHFQVSDIWMAAVFWIVASIVSVTYAIMLLARTDWIVAKFKFPEDPPSSGMEPVQLLRAGLVLVGTYVILESLPAVGNITYSFVTSQAVGFHSSRPDFGTMIRPALGFILGCIVIGKSDRFAKSIFPPADPPA